MNSHSSSEQVVAEMIGKKTFRPLISVRRGERQSGGGHDILIVEGISLYRKSLQIIPSGPYRLSFVVEGVRQEYAVRVANKTVVRADDNERLAA